MKKLLMMSLLFACHGTFYALESAQSNTVSTIGQMCGDDNCDCGGLKRPELIL